MSVSIKSAREIELMRAAGKILAKVHENLGKELKEGMSTLDIDRLGDEIIRSYGRGEDDPQLWLYSFL